MKRYGIIGLPVFLSFVLGTLPGCGSGESEANRKTKVAVVTNCTAEFWYIAEAGANKAAKDLDVEVIFRQPPTMSVASQKEILDTVTRLGISGIAVSVINPEEQTPDLTRLGKRMPLLTMDNDAEKTGRLGYVGIDNYEAGKAVGRLIQQAKPDGGTIAMFIGNTTSANARARAGGVLDQLAGEKDAKGPKYGNYTLYRNEPFTDNGDEAKAQDNARDVLEQLKNTPDVIMVGLYAYNPKAIVQAAKSKGLVDKITIVGFDEDWTTLEGIAEGTIIGTVVQDPFQYGYQSVEILTALANDDDSKIPDAPIPYRVITKDGGPEETVNGVLVKNLPVDEFREKLKADLALVKK